MRLSAENCLLQAVVYEQQDVSCRCVIWLARCQSSLMLSGDVMDFPSLRWVEIGVLPDQLVNQDAELFAWCGPWNWIRWQVEPFVTTVKIFVSCTTVNKVTWPCRQYQISNTVYVAFVNSLCSTPRNIERKRNTRSGSGSLVGTATSSKCLNCLLSLLG